MNRYLLTTITIACSAGWAMADMPSGAVPTSVNSSRGTSTNQRTSGNQTVNGLSPRQSEGPAPNAAVTNLNPASPSDLARPTNLSNSTDLTTNVDPTTSLGAGTADTTGANSIGNRPGMTDIGNRNMPDMSARGNVQPLTGPQTPAKPSTGGGTPGGTGGTTGIGGK